MTVSITRRQRTALLFLSASGYLAWFAGLGEPIGAQDLGSARQARIRLPERTRLVRIGGLVRRDPFAIAPTPGTTIVTPDGVAATERAAAASTSGLAVPDIVPNDTSRQENSLFVRATITGAHPVAYVANGSAMDIVRVGDVLGDRRIAAIDLHGIAFADGSRLDLPDGFARAPARHSSAITLSIDDLRRLLAPAAPVASPSANGAPTSAPSVVSSPATPALQTSPAPLPTVDRSGLHPGENPTPDVVDPTPYPNPYPYAPGTSHRT